MASKGKKPIRTTTRTRRRRHRNHFKKNPPPSPPPCSINSDVTSTSSSSSSLLSSTATSSPSSISATSPSSISASGCCTPKSEKSRIPEMLTCPPAPKKQKVGQNCALRRRQISFFAPQDLELFFVFSLAHRNQQIDK